VLTLADVNHTGAAVEAVLAPGSSWLEPTGANQPDEGYPRQVLLERAPARIQQQVAALSAGGAGGAEADTAAEGAAAAAAAAGTVADREAITEAARLLLETELLVRLDLFRVAGDAVEVVAAHLVEPA
jgi:hypothetical protein